MNEDFAKLISFVRRSVKFNNTKIDTGISEQSIFSLFLQELQLQGGQNKISAKEFYNEIFVNWAATKGYSPIPTQRAFGLALKGLLPYKRTNGNRPHYYLNSDLRKNKREKKT